MGRPRGGILRTGDHRSVLQGRKKNSSNWECREVAPVSAAWGTGDGASLAQPAGMSQRTCCCWWLSGCDGGDTLL